MGQTGIAMRMTIEELAAASGLTVRNIREHQTRGLLPPPVLVGRKGTYDERHVARLRLIVQLQREGLNLGAIDWLLQRAPAETTDEVVRFERALFAPWGFDAPEQWTAEQLNATVGLFDEAVLERAVALDVVRPAEGGTWEIPSPRLLQAGADLRAIGVPLEAALDVVDLLREHTSAVARAFVRLFVDHVWGPFDAAGRPPDQWEQVRSALERLRPIATQALLAVFQQSMQATVAASVDGEAGPRQESA